MQTNIYKGQTTGWYEFDKIIYGNATSLNPEDEVMLGRYVLLCYCETAFTEAEKLDIESRESNDGLTDDRLDYWNNYNIDKISKDRMIYKKVYKYNQAKYVEIGKINEINVYNNAGIMQQYDASNIVTVQDIVISDKIGSYNRTDKIDSGTDLQTILNNMLSQRLQPDATNPSATIVLTNVGPNGGNVIGEIGSPFIAKYKTTFSSGSFTYGPATGCTSTKATVFIDDKDKSVTITANGLDGATGSLAEFKIPDDTPRTLTLLYGWTASNGTPVDNLGDDATNKDEIKIDAASGQIAYSTHTVTGYRNYWYGFSSSTEYTDITRNTSTNICSGGTNTLIAGDAAISNKTLPTITATEDDDRMPVVVMPTNANKRVVSATMPSSLNAPVTFTKLGTINLQGYSYKGIDGDLISYDVWGYIANNMPIGADFSIVIGQA